MLSCVVPLLLLGAGLPLKQNVLHGVMLSFAISGSSGVNYLFPRWKEDSLQPTYSILQTLSSSSLEARPQTKDSPCHKCAVLA
jgi:hypothetical protein